MSNIAWLKELSKKDVAIVGGKGANLAELYNLGIPVPPAFCITTEAYKRFLREENIEEDIYSSLDDLDVEDSDALYEAAEEVQSLIINAEMPEDLKAEILEAYDNLNVDIDVFKVASKPAMDIIKAGRDLQFVAVRSSATAEDLETASFAGQQATFLNVKGREELIKAVKKCWASLFTGRAIYYRVKNSFEHRKVFISVIVQKMVNSTAAGVIFTCNPATQNEKEIVTEACFGLGEALVSGAIRPDKYVVDKDTLEIKDQKINTQEFMYIRDPRLGKTVRRNLFEDEGGKQKLTDAQIKKLSRYSKQIDEHYGIAQDIEFATEGEKIYIVQTRPVTTLGKVEEKKEEVPEEEKVILLKGLAASPHVGTGPVRLVYSVEDLSKVKEGDVLVTKMTNPDMVVAMKRAVGIITDEGGISCHAAIVGREMGLPVIVGTLKATQLLKEDEVVTVDGIKGEIYKGKVEVEEPVEEVKPLLEQIETVTDVKVILDLPEYAKGAAATGAGGVGLLRCEFMILHDKEHPVYLIEQGRKDELVEKLANDIKSIAKEFDKKPVWYRTLDAPTDEFRHLKGGENEPEEDNPLMGWRSIRRDLDQPELLKAQFEAIKKVHDEGFTNVGVMIPLVTHVEQVRKAKEALKEVGLEPLENIEFGVMIETPAAVQIIEDLCKEGLDFVSFGTNDLTAFTLAVDRNNAKIQHLFDEMHPAVLNQMSKVIKVCREYNVETSICGQAGSRPEMAEWLVKQGIDSITANSDAVRMIKHVVAKAERKLLLKVARERA